MGTLVVLLTGEVGVYVVPYEVGTGAGEGGRDLGLWVLVISTGEGVGGAAGCMTGCGVMGCVLGGDI